MFFILVLYQIFFLFTRFFTFFPFLPHSVTFYLCEYDPLWLSGGQCYDYEVHYQEKQLWSKNSDKGKRTIPTAGGILYKGRLPFV